jgi:histone H2A
LQLLLKYNLLLIKIKSFTINLSLRAGLQFPVGRIHRFLKESLSHRGRVGATAAVYSAAILVFICFAVLLLKFTFSVII